MADVTMPQLGETVTEGTITRWFKQPGETVEMDEVLFEVSTDKVDSEVPSPAAGTLTEILVPEGETVDVGVVLAVIGDGAAAPAAAPAAAAPEPAVAPAPAPPAPAPPAPAAGAWRPVGSPRSRARLIGHVPRDLAGGVGTRTVDPPRRTIGLRHHRCVGGDCPLGRACR